jgi:hypothetical protein
MDSRPEAIAEDVFVSKNGSPASWTNDTLARGTSVLDIHGFNEGDVYDIFILSYRAAGSIDPADTKESSHITGTASIPIVPQKPPMVGATGLSIVFKS